VTVWHGATIQKLALDGGFITTPTLSTQYFRRNCQIVRPPARKSGCRHSRKRCRLPQLALRHDVLWAQEWYAGELLRHTKTICKVCCRGQAEGKISKGLCRRVHPLTTICRSRTRQPNCADENQKRGLWQPRRMLKAEFPEGREVMEDQDGR
jgi:hypothetical protein